jgi:hypothetical protein
MRRTLLLAMLLSITTVACEKTQVAASNTVQRVEPWEPADNDFRGCEGG